MREKNEEKQGTSSVSFHVPDFVGEDGVEYTDIEVIVEATGNPAVGIRHARAAIAAGKHIVMVNVEADVLAGPLLADEARKAGAVYSLAYEAPASNWLGTSMPLQDRAVNIFEVLLTEPGLRTGPVIFVCHSLGGLIVKIGSRMIDASLKTKLQSIKIAMKEVG